MTNVSTNPGFYTTPVQLGLDGHQPADAGRADPARRARGRPHRPRARVRDPGDQARTCSRGPRSAATAASMTPNAIPEGTRFRLDPSLDLNTIQMAPVVRMIAEAAQDYGIVLRDGAGSVTFYGEDPTPTGTNPYAGPTGWFQGKSPATLMQQTRRQPRLRLRRRHLRLLLRPASAATASTAPACRCARPCATARPGFDCPFANAFWNGSQMVYGDGLRRRRRRRRPRADPRRHRVQLAPLLLLPVGRDQRVALRRLRRVRRPHQRRAARTRRRRAG